MRTRRGLAPGLVPIVVSGTATVFKLIVACLTVAGAYFGAVAMGPDQGTAEGTAAGRPAIRTVTLSARALPAEDARVPRPGTVAAALADAGPSCRRVYHVQSVIDPAGEPIVYEWRLARWSASAHAWRTYLVSATAGFMGGQRTVEWYPRVVGNPGWYRAELSIRGEADAGPRRTVTGERFQISC
ncbi:hypothetical protein Skr01_63430 [Sphaerisporangium krabiense]|uniref:Uncharacterized protein n=1 Tax=Sphaerisporangium krabiense TaxID=763782 RepID=A0A7W8Z6H2_9ACTN|nr:hypothetical protein [Sphaerisporangium krabiense]MBB5628262.1 hypothetical protein [Sphaerisporangium krabiense]GII66258.1 hypothetical protein Skr01_63430 [Sphaerisporangium krabiense]